MSIEAPRQDNIDYVPVHVLNHVVIKIFQEVDGATRLEEREVKAFINHITNFLDAINTKGDKKLLQKVKESRQRLQKLGISQDMISGSEVVAARAVIENLAEKLAIYRQGEEAK